MAIKKEEWRIDEIDEESELYLTIREAHPYLQILFVGSICWNYRLEGRMAWVDNEECEVSNIKWQVMVEDEESL